ncbi:MAG: hypothetical protein ACTSVL_02095 [Promethearchaeota archaeon]
MPEIEILFDIYYPTPSVFYNYYQILSDQKGIHPKLAKSPASLEIPKELI